jgi:hypothetical protein
LLDGVGVNGGNWCWSLVIISFGFVGENKGRRTPTTISDNTNLVSFAGTSAKLKLKLTDCPGFESLSDHPTEIWPWKSCKPEIFAGNNRVLALLPATRRERSGFC